MINAETIASYFLSKDPKRKLFNNNLVEKNNRKFYEGNARLNKYLFLAQVVYFARYEQRLISDNFLAYANGPIVKKIQTNYLSLSNNHKNIDIPQDIKKFLDKIYDALKDANYDELIEITHEDPEWIRLSKQTLCGPTMYLEKHIREYKQRYKGIIEALDL